jgi:predicted regulator of Ras-like GTPase activity (Roadblock/LC7/MglB family)
MSVKSVSSSATFPQPLDLSRQQLDDIDACLHRLKWEGKARCVLLADITGQLIEAKGDLGKINTAVLSALAAGQISATREMARLVGEEAQFKLLLHEGEQQSVYLSDVIGELVLVAIFDTSTPIGMVRLFTKLAVETIADILRRVDDKDVTEQDEAFNSDFAKLVAAEMDASFGNQS